MTAETIDRDLQRELLDMARRDHILRDQLAASGVLFDGYNPEMEKLHAANAERLDGILQSRGWPGRSLVGVGGARAAWLVVQHAIAMPGFQRRALELLKRAVVEGEAPAWQAAMLEDRVRLFEGRPQLYGTQFDWDEEGRLVPYPPIEDIENVDDRRRSAGLEPLGVELRRQREEAAAWGERPPADVEERRRRIEAWARKAGWRD